MPSSQRHGGEAEAFRAALVARATETRGFGRSASTTPEETSWSALLVTKPFDPINVSCTRPCPHLQRCSQGSPRSPVPEPSVRPRPRMRPRNRERPDEARYVSDRDIARCVVARRKPLLCPRGDLVVAISDAKHHRLGCSSRIASARLRASSAWLRQCLGSSTDAVSVSVVDKARAAASFGSHARGAFASKLVPPHRGKVPPST